MFQHADILRLNQYRNVVNYNIVSNAFVEGIEVVPLAWGE